MPRPLDPLLAGLCSLAMLGPVVAEPGCGLSVDELHRIAGAPAREHYDRVTALPAGLPPLAASDWPAPTFVERHEGRCRVLYGGNKAGPAATVDIDARGNILGIRSYHAAK
ncbi:hypothetical protein [Plasticicumulans sp.]|uniref:hypothetical protein n=1 Tax=Plasticicumulans sp. TaxID=2307179 RepID=UPI002C3CFC8A|nr:hypothetical protein [Pseudomonadota bacterium]HNK31667.1 hypothetical protein [Plasticicumulans sp.]